MEPPSYEEASLHPSAFNVLPPPYYHGPQHSPPTPPPTYGEAVSTRQDPFPVLTLPTAQTSRNHGTVIHPITQIGAVRHGGSRRPQPAAVVVTQPAPVPVSVRHLGDIPALVRCPHCNRVVTTVVKHVPGMSAWSLCVFLALMGLICGFCLIPFMVQSLQDVHHYCPECKNRLHVHQR
uniref:lipopolysaccharide-induced tumor necrosis factor-alpha factor homolog n=1 Tax=Gasterosteus aculeatus aculeatus TaxID=481459 RepID=UPI001A99D41E|nr:lipopolysaccharide-induced tumor necrosis factor-alpha factor homolog [Gasterosteus aculeatus aculeatus]XP_040042021.1 lipopolysaccharide-induced tumor necrosis factor-alpha factor homolog [Gasterosteus aculeatus aculeatus]